jgi:predicted enzyme related to lactoylglutathione lyase
MTKLIIIALLAACASRTCPPAPVAKAAPLRIHLSTIYVDDQDKALAFYTDVLGFVKKDDESNGGYRWLTVTAPGEAMELQLALDTSNPAGKAFQEAMFQQSQPAAMFYTSDVQADYERMKARGTVFTMPPTDVTMAKIATLNDTCGNLIQLTQLN